MALWANIEGKCVGLVTDVMRNEHFHGAEAIYLQLGIPLCSVYRGGVVSGSLEV